MEHDYTPGSAMHITEWRRTNEHCSIGSAAGEGLHYRFVVLNSNGEITHLQQLIDDEWLAVAEPAPMFLRTLVAAKMADEQWRHGSN
jgi:hypothetical protein